MPLNGVEGVTPSSGPNRVVRTDGEQREQVELKELQRDHEKERDAGRRRGDVTDVSIEDIAEHIQDLNSILRTYDKGLEFLLHEGTDEYYVQVMDLIEEEVIRQIPPEEVLDIAARIDEMIGIIIDERI